MRPMTRRTALATLGAAALCPLAAAATERRYVLDKAASSVGFRFFVNGIAQAGTMPVSAADILIDPDRPAASRVDVTLDVTGARTALPLATQAMIGPDVLHAARFPVIRFSSTSIRLSAKGRLSGGATVTGALTLRGLTLPITLNANVFRARGSGPNDLSTLTVRLDGAISRAAFGASGFSGFVGDAVELDITAVIRSAT